MKNNTTTTKKSALIVGIILAIVLPSLAISSSLVIKDIGLSNETQFYISRFTIWFSLFLLLLYCLKVEKRPFLLWGETEYRLLVLAKAVFKTMLKLFLAVIVTSLLISLFNVNTESAVLKKALALFKNNYLLLFFTCLTAGITEELFFRGYLLPRLALLLKNQKLAIVLSSILFGLMHLGYGTLVNVVGPIVIGLIFAFQYEKYRNIKIVIICHFLWDLFLLTAKTH